MWLRCAFPCELCRLVATPERVKEAHSEALLDVGARGLSEVVRSVSRLRPGLRYGYKGRFDIAQGCAVVAGETGHRGTEESLPARNVHLYIGRAP